MNIKYWCDVNGKRHLIKDMSTEYLHNCIHYANGRIIRGRPWRLNYIKAIKNELKRRGLSPEGINFEF